MLRNMQGLPPSVKSSVRHGRRAELSVDQLAALAMIGLLAAGEKGVAVPEKAYDLARMMTAKRRLGR